MKLPKNTSLFRIFKQEIAIKDYSLVNRIYPIRLKKVYLFLEVLVWQSCSKFKTKYNKNISILVFLTHEPFKFDHCAISFKFHVLQ